MFRLVSSALAFAVAIAALSWDGADQHGRRRVSENQLARASGLNTEYHLAVGDTDCSEIQVLTDGIPMSHCWNYDEDVAGVRCYICEGNDELYPVAYPFDTGHSTQSPGNEDPCGGNLIEGVCLDPDGGGQYICAPINPTEVPCDGEIQDWNTQALPGPGTENP